MEVFRADLHNFPLRAYLDATRDAIGSGRLADLLRPYGITEADLRDSTAWVSLEFVEAFLHDIITASGDPDHFVRATRLSMTPKYIGAAAPLVTAFGTPLFAFGQLGKSAAVFNRTGAWAMELGEPGHVRMTFRHHDTAPRERTDIICRCRQIQMAMLPTLFGRSVATVDHPRCMLRGDELCDYDISWVEPPRRKDSWVGFAGGGAIGAALAWTLSAGSWHPALLVGGNAAGGWALGRLRVLRAQLVARVNEIAEHNDALAKMSRAHELRFAELLDAKAEVEKKVDMRTFELKEASDKLSETLEEVRAVDRAKTDFFNNVSHELRSPLTMIVAPLEDLAAGREPPGGTQAALDAMRRNARRLLQLINQLLDLAKVDAGEVRVAPVPTDLAALVRGILSGFEAPAGRKGVKLELTCPASMRSLAIDVSWIESAITNLIANALRVTERGGVRVTIEDHGSDVVVSIADDGPGIALEDQAKIFERFAQGDIGKRVVGGTGIGLSLVREAARLHQGAVSVSSEVGKGATFVLRLPRRALQPSAIPSTPPQVLLLGTAAAEGAAMMADLEAAGTNTDRDGPSPDAPLIVIVEDNVELRRFMADVLGARFRVRSAADGIEAIALVHTHRPDVVVSDVAMPRMNGYELCRALRADEQTRSIPVLLVTARTEVASVLEGFDAGASDYVLKPFHGRELLARVDVHVRLRRTLHQLALRERHAMLGVMAASVAHQVRNPLTALVGGLPAMRGRVRERVDERTLELIDVMIDCAARIERMTSDLMNLSRVDRESESAYKRNRPTDHVVVP